MRVEALVWLLTNIASGRNTLYLLKQKKSSVIVDYLRWCVKHGFLEYSDELFRNRRTYSLTERGRALLKVLPEYTDEWVGKVDNTVRILSVPVTSIRGLYDDR